MSDPERLLSPRSDADPLERALLASLHRAGPSDTARAQAWQAIATNLSVAAAAGAAAASASSAGAAQLVATKTAGDAGLASATTAVASKALLPKVMLLVVTLGAAGAGTSALLHRAQPPRHATLPSRTVAAEALRPAAVPEVAVAVAPCGSPGGTPCDDAGLGSQPRAREPRRKPSEALVGESRLVTLARSELRRGNVSGARAALTRLERQFPRGTLGQEREVLSIELYAAQGRAALARRRAQAFIAAHPESPHSARLARFVDAP